MPFHKNINALRALAVMAVVLYHFKVEGFSGGFIGVDVFFVISGFLMTAILFNGLRGGSFSLLGFYASRARRIIPALAVLCAALMVFGFVYLSLSDYRELLRTVKDSLLFVSNHSFAEDGSYFDSPLKENWLLHTWSLSVEWQFYLLYPVVVLALFKWLGERKTRQALFLIGGSSLLASVLVTPAHPVFAFYLLPTRAWEMIAGGLVFLYPLALSRAGRTVFEVCGLGLILAGIWLFSEADLWPGHMALVPVIGTMLVIHANTDSLFSRNAPLQALGSISYSVYLWHWPIVVFLYLCGLLGSSMPVVSGMVLAVVLGALSYYAVETRVARRGAPGRVLLKYAGSGLALVAVAAVTASAVKRNPELRFAFVEQSQPQYISQLYEQQCQPNPFNAYDCLLGAGKVSAILLGDSHARATAAALQLNNKEAALGWSLAGCPTLINFEMGNKSLEKDCRAFNQAKLAVLNKDYRDVPVVLFSRAGLYSDYRRDNSYRVYFNGDRQQDEKAFAQAFTAEYTRTVCEIARQHPVYIVKPIPEMPFSIYKGLSLQSRILGRTSDISAPLAGYEQRNQLAITAIDAAARACNAKVIDPVPYLCPDGQCMGSKDGEALYFDDNHLVDSGNQQLRSVFRQVFTPI